MCVCVYASGSVLVCVRAGVKASACWHVGMLCVLTFILGKTFNNKAALRVAFVCEREGERGTARERGVEVCVCECECTGVRELIKSALRCAQLWQSVKYTKLKFMLPTFVRAEN